MKKKYYGCLIALIFLNLPIIAQQANVKVLQEEIIDIGTDRQLFVDHYLIESLDNEIFLFIRE